MGIGCRIRNSLRRASVLKLNKKSTGAVSDEEIVKTRHTEIEDDRSSSSNHSCDDDQQQHHQFRSTFRSTITSTTCDTCPDDVDDEPSAFEKEEDSFKSFLDNAAGVEDSVSTSEEPTIRQSLVAAQSSVMDADSSAVSCRASSTTVDPTAQRRSRRRYQRRCSVTKYSFEEPSSTEYSRDGGALAQQREDLNTSHFERSRYAQASQC